MKSLSDTRTEQQTNKVRQLETELCDTKEKLAVSENKNQKLSDEIENGKRLLESALHSVHQMEREVLEAQHVMSRVQQWAISLSTDFTETKKQLEETSAALVELKQHQK